MTYIPNVRNQFEAQPIRVDLGNGQYRFEEKLLRNAYWQGFLNEENKHVIQNYDWALWNALSFFDNLERWQEEIAEALDLRMTDERLNKLGKVLQDAFDEFVEEDRGEFVVSLLDNQEYPEEYKDGVPSDPAPEGYVQHEDGLEGLEGLEPWQEDWYKMIQSKDEE